MSELQIVRIVLPPRFNFLLEMHPFKVAYGGRNGLKSWSFADAIIALGCGQRLRVVVGRQVLKSLADSAHKLFCDRIEALGLNSFYQVLENKIRGANGTEISYGGLNELTAQSAKSLEAVDIYWVEEAQTVSDEAWQVLLPSIRAPNSEVWVSFNPGMDTDPTWKRFVEHPPKGAVVVKSTWEYAKACGFFTEKMEEQRKYDLQYYPQDYDNIWEGKPRTVVAGAIYAREIMEMIEEQRIRPTPYDPRLPVHTVWDLGWNDAMSIIMVQKPTPSTLNVINYLEDSFKTYAEYIADLNALRYVWGTDWLPHDGASKDPKTGQSAQQVLAGLGRKVKVIGRGDVEAGIRSARMMFPRCYIDNTTRKRASGHLGAARLIDCLKRYARNVPTTTGEPSTPLHDQYSHAADAWRGLAMIVDQIRNDGDIVIEPMPAFHNTEPSMGVLG